MNKVRDDKKANKGLPATCGKDIRPGQHEPADGNRFITPGMQQQIHEGQANEAGDKY
jgi:hypothetical protein